MATEPSAGASGELVSVTIRERANESLSRMPRINGNRSKSLATRASARPFNNSGCAAGLWRPISSMGDVNP